MKILAFDFETFAFTRENTTLTPTPVCISYARCNGESGVLAHCDEGFIELIEEICDPNNTDTLRIAHFNAFDTGVIFKHFPHLVTKLFDCFEMGLFEDTVLREKLLNLTVLGWIDEGETAHGEYVRKNYGLDAIMQDRFKLDLSDVKKAEDAWRLRYKELYNMPAKDYPREAYDYALFDSIYALKIYQDQEKRRETIVKRKGFDPWDFEGRCKEKLGISYVQFKTMISFDAQLISAQGLRVNKEAKHAVVDWLEEEFTEDKLNLLFEHGVLRPAVPPMPYANGALDHSEDCVNYKTKVPKAKRPHCNCPPKMKAAEEVSKDLKQLGKFIAGLYMKGYIEELKFTKKGRKDLKFRNKFARLKGEELHQLLLEHPTYLSADKAFLEEYAALDPVLAQYQHRQSLLKIKNTEIPRICLNGEDGDPADYVFPSFDVMKKTSRFSSYGSATYPSLNVQNIHAKMRQLIMPREGHWFYSIDYASLEFISAAWRFQDMGVESMYARIINEDGNAHGYLATQLAYDLDPEERFKAMCEEANIDSDDYYSKYELFMTLKEDKDFKYSVNGVNKLDNKGEPYTYFSYWRTFSKPVGLGIVGGMGPGTVATTAKTMFGLEITPEEAKAARDVDLKCLPEVAIYLDAIKKHCIDHEHTKRKTIEEVKSRKVTLPNGEVVEEFYTATKTYKDTKYVYDTPLGLRRPNCNFTAAANGAALQSPSTEGVQVGMHLLVRETFDPSKNSILYGNNIPTGMIHDEFVGDVVADPVIAQKVMDRMIECMNAGLQFVCPGIKSKAEPAIMEKEWSKAAFDFYNEDGNIVPFEWSKK